VHLGVAVNGHRVGDEQCPVLERQVGADAGQLQQSIDGEPVTGRREANASRHVQCEHRVGAAHVDAVGHVENGRVVRVGLVRGIPITVVGRSVDPSVIASIPRSCCPSR
jgi:hypothetical protein